MAESRRVAFLSDVHANYEALRAVEEDAREIGVDRWVFCGDAVGLGPDPNEVLDWLRKKKAVCVLGNVDFNVLHVVKRQQRYREPTRYHKYLSYGWNWNELRQENRLFLASFKKLARPSLFGCKSLIVHGLLGDFNGILSPEFAETEGKRLLKKQGCEIFVAGHSHRPFVLQTTRGWLVNCGSVGIPRKKPGLATYVLGQFDPELEPVFEVRKVRYSPGAVADRFKLRGLPKELATPFTTASAITKEALKALERYMDEPRFQARMEE